MIWSIINEADIFYCDNCANTLMTPRSSNPYDYVRAGYYVDNASLFGGKNIVNFNSCFSSVGASHNISFPCVGKRSFRNIP